MNLRKSVDEKCKECIYDPYQEGTWRQQVEGCTSPNCALFEHRPLTAATTAKRQEERVACMNPKQFATYRARQARARVNLA